jgi:hypothetical protein
MNSDEHFLKERTGDLAKIYQIWITTLCSSHLN